MKKKNNNNTAKISTTNKTVYKIITRKLESVDTFSCFPILRSCEHDVLDHTFGLRGLTLAVFSDTGAIYTNGRSVGNVAEAMGVGIRADLSVFSFIERATVRFDMAKTINAGSPIGDDTGRPLDVEGARAALAALGKELGLGVEATAEAILAVVNTRMAGRMRLISVEQGHDPRMFALVAFGGAGPLHGSALLREVGLKTMLVPGHPGVLCAMGCIVADLCRFEPKTRVAV